MRVVNNDVMPHRLVQISGPKIPIFAANMHKMGAHAWFTLAGKGVYVFKTRPGADYRGMEMDTLRQPVLRTAGEAPRIRPSAASALAAT